MVAKHLKTPLFTALNGFGTYCWKKVIDNAVVMCPDSALIKHMNRTSNYATYILG